MTRKFIWMVWVLGALRDIGGAGSNKTVIHINVMDSNLQGNG